MGATPGWSWERDHEGVPLGPHGLYMTAQAATAYATRAQPILADRLGTLTDTAKVPRTFWAVKNWNDTGHLKYYWNGWFLSDRWAYAIGHRVQVIAVSKGEIRRQLVHDSFDTELDATYYAVIDNIESTRRHHAVARVRSTSTL